MTWTCEQTEARLSDYLDGALSVAEQSAFDGHVNACPRCTPLVASVSHLLSGLHSMEQLEPPPRLVYSILDKTLGPRETATGWLGLLGWVRGIASIRFAYGALSVVATLIIFVTASGFNWRKPNLADLQPANIYHKADSQAHLVYARSTKFVSDLRVVNEIQSRLRQESEIPANPESTVPQPSPEKQPGRTDGSQPSTPRQQNRANGISRDLEVLALAMPAACGKLSMPLMARNVR
jgi:anti-sigma factor RsiW